MPRTKAQQAAEARYEASGKRPKRVQVKLTLTPEQYAELQRRSLPKETAPAAVLRLAGLTTNDEE